MQVRAVTSAAERQQVYEFRYRMYVELEGRTQHHADHDRRMVHEPLDERGSVIAAFEGGQVVGTLRTNMLREGPLGYYDHLYGIDHMTPAQRQHVSITTKLIVAPHHRGGACAMRMSKLTFQRSLAKAARWDFIDSREHTLSYFRKLGYRELDNRLMHPEYGRATLLRLDLCDERHLASVRSPFLSTLRSQLATQQSA